MTTPDVRRIQAPDAYYVIETLDGVVWTDTAYLHRAEHVAKALRDAGHGSFQVRCLISGEVLHTAVDTL